MKDKISLGAKTVFITGGTSGIGLATAQLFLEKGCNVCVFSNLIPKNAEVVALQANSRALVAEGDIRDAKQVRKVLAQALRRFKSIDILVNNAGVATSKPFIDMSKRETDFIIDVNLRGTLVVTQETLKIMHKKKSGVVLTISSGSALFGVKNLSIYSLTKAALLNLTQSLAQEHEKDGIHFATITPASTETALFRQLFPTEKAAHTTQDVARVIYKTATGEIKPNENLVVDVFHHIHTLHNANK